MEIAYVFASIVLLVLLISWGKVQPFLAFLVSSSVAAILLGLPMDKVPGVLEKGIGNILGGLVAHRLHRRDVRQARGEQRRGPEDRHGAHAVVRRETPYLGADVHRLPRGHPAVLQRGLRAAGAAGVLGGAADQGAAYLSRHPHVRVVVGDARFPAAAPRAHGHAAHVRRRHRHHAVLRAHRRVAGHDHRRARVRRAVSQREVEPDHAVRGAAAARERAAERVQLFCERAAAGRAHRLLDGRAARARSLAAGVQILDQSATSSCCCRSPSRRTRSACRAA